MVKGNPEAFRMQVVSRARAFKRSWVDMAEALTRVRERGYHKTWGFETLHGYALEELNIKRATCDKLTGSFAAMEQHIPHALTWDGVAQAMPEMEAVDYFRRAVIPPEPKEGEEPREPPEQDVIDELKQAIFEDQASTPSVRRRFQSVLYPKSDDDKRLELLHKVRANAQRLEGLVIDVEGLEEERVEQVTTCLEELRADLDALEQG